VSIQDLQEARKRSLGIAIDEYGKNMKFLSDLNVRRCVQPFSAAWTTRVDDLDASYAHSS